MFLVTGGYYAGTLDSTEIFDPNFGSWSDGSALPNFFMSTLRAITIDNRVLLFGIYTYYKDTNTLLCF